MTEETGPSEAWVTAVMAMSRTLGQTIPDGITRATVGDWDMTINNSKEAAGDIPPFGIELKHSKLLAFGVLTPSGGMIGGYAEDEFIADMADPLPGQKPE